MPSRNVIVAAALLALLSGCDVQQGGTGKVVLPEPDSPGARILKENCSKCHGAPGPAVHTAEEWPNVIYRMQEHRRMTGYSLIVPDELELLLDYLKRHAKS
jgi:hypothetical protein